MWRPIVGQGTVRLSSDSYQAYTLSVMHQLHCIVSQCHLIKVHAECLCRLIGEWSIHQSFYTILHTTPGEAADLHDFPHIRHCFDYIRQGLMCSADTSLEPVDMVLGGVTGWNSTHICRDFSSVAQWAEDHRTNNLRGFREVHKAHGEHGSSWYTCMLSEG